MGVRFACHGLPGVKLFDCFGDSVLKGGGLRFRFRVKVLATFVFAVILYLVPRIEVLSPLPRLRLFVFLPLSL